MLPVCYRAFVLCLLLLATACQPLSINNPAPVATSQRAPVIIVGGGLAGLTTAYKLEKQGIRTVLLEESDALGGRVATAHYPGGLQAEYGLQELWHENPAIELAQELGLSLDSSNGEAFSSVIIDGKLHPYIQGTLSDYFKSFLSASEQDALQTWLNKATKLHSTALTAGVAAPEVLALQNISFSEWIKRGGLPHTPAELVRLSIECELAESWDNISALSGLIEFGAFLNGGQKNYHIHGGNSRLIEALTDAMKGPKLFNARVTGIERRAKADGTIEVDVYYQKNRKLEHISGSAAVLAIPFTRVPAVSLTPPLSAAKRTAITTLGRGQYSVVHLIVDRNARNLWEIGGRSPFPVLTQGLLGVIYGFRNEGADNSETEVFTLLLHGSQARRVHMHLHDEVIAEVVSELSKLWPGFGRHVHAGYLYDYHPAAIAVWPPGRSPIDTPAKALLEPELGLYFAGDWLMSAHSDGAVNSALGVANRLQRDLLTEPARTITAH